MRRSWGVLTIVLFCLALSCLPACSPTGGSGKIKVATTTSLLSVMAHEVGGDRVSTTVIIPPGACPGHFDPKPSDVQALADAKLFLKHGWEGFAANLVKGANNSNLAVVDVKVDGNWMLPEVQAKAVEPVVAAVSNADPSGKQTYQERGDKYRKEVLATGDRLKAKAMGKLKGIKVLCSQQQEPFIRWAGFEILDSFGRPEDTTSQKMKELVDKGKAGKARLVINNLQSDPDAGKGLAQEIGAVQLNVSNFPGAFDGTDTWAKALERNIDLLIEAVGKGG